MPQLQERVEAKIISCSPKNQRLHKLIRRSLSAFGLAIATTLLVILIQFQSSAKTKLANSQNIFVELTPASLPAAVLPALQAHPLPPTLAQWQDVNNSNDYFSQVKPTKLGYLIWSLFPIKIYIEQPVTVSSSNQAQNWATAVLQAVQEWKVYLPLIVVQQLEAADISIWRSAPPLQFSPTGKISRARTAETRYEFYLRQASANSEVLSFRCQIWLSPNQTNQYIQATARHELGHALGIWGHSPVATDALYFSQVRNPLPISARDINTLKRVYQQPTRLGWSWNREVSGARETALETRDIQGAD